MRTEVCQDKRSPELRTQAYTLAKTDTAAALEIAASMTDSWYRAQSLACVARYAAPDQVESIIGQAFDATREMDDPYRRVAVSAWPLAALVERGLIVEAWRELDTPMADVDSIQPMSSRSEALIDVFMAVFPLGESVWAPVYARIKACAEISGFWRCERAMAYATAIAAADDGSFGESAVAGMPDGSLKRRTERYMLDSRYSRPRVYFGP